MRTIDDARSSWPLLERIHALSDLKDAMRDGNAGPAITSGLRSVCWKTFLLFENVDRSTWTVTLADSRGVYTTLRSHYLRAIEHPEEVETSIDPLNDSEELSLEKSPWAALRKDEAIRAEIFQDVERCMPDNVYFRQPATQKMLLDILFIWCKLNPDIGYRQGMHELLAPILWVIERDAIERRERDLAKPEEDLMASMFDQDYIEHDTFSLFGIIMQNAKEFFAPSESPQVESPMITRSKRIFEKLLPNADPELAAHLVKLDIVPQIFLMRWVRLLFGREFPFDQSLRMWDVIFSEDPSLEIVDLICVAMLLRIRWELLDSDTNNAFSLLMRYPEQSMPAHTFVTDAIYLKNNLSTKSGHYLVSRYSNRSPERVNHPDKRPLTPQSARPLSPFGSPIRILPQPGGFESFLQNAARDVLQKSEKWGVNKTIREAMGEVKRNMKEFQSGRSTPSARYARAKRFSTPSANPATTSQAEALSRVAELETRNKELAKMLEAAVAELWECQNKRDKEEGETESEDALSLAIAKVQFVQVYLEDPAIPLPNAEPASDSTPNEVTPQTSTQPKSSFQDRPQDPPTPSSEVLFDAEVPEEPTATSPPPPSLPPTTTASTASTKSSSPALTPTTSKPPPPANPLPSAASSRPASTALPAHARARPSITSASFSWMLGHDASSDADTRASDTSTAAASTFASAAGRSAFPAERRRAAARSKESSFLFGEEDDGAVGGGVFGGAAEGGGKVDVGRGLERVESIELGVKGAGK